jgi:hypothetical protein
MKISNFNKENIITEIGHGVEGIVYLYNDNGQVVSFKKFYTGEDYDSNDNKELKLIILENESVLKNDIKLLNRIYSMGKFIGFTSVYEPYQTISYDDSPSKKIKFLSLLKERYEELNKHNIYIGDFYINNFGFVDNRIKLFDIDNYRIDDLDFNAVDDAMIEYQNKCYNINNIDYFCFNYFALSLLASVEPEMILRGIYDEIPKKLKTKEIINFMEELRHIDDYYSIKKDNNGKTKTLLNIINKKMY